MTTHEDWALVTESLEIAAAQGGDLTAAVYARLFHDRPDLEPLFVMDKNGAVRGEMLARVFDAILDFVGDRTYAHNLISAEATNHEGYLVPRDAFAGFFQIVATVVREACGAEWTSGTDAAWQRLLSDMRAYVGV